MIELKKILVIGTLNMDTVIETPYIPKSGETLAGRSVSLVPGGKGANQAYAAGKLVIVDPAPPCQICLTPSGWVSITSNPAKGSFG